MKLAPIEAAARPGQPFGMSPAAFLRTCWQKRPLLVRGAFPQFGNAITPEDLAGLACEDAALARIAIRDARRDRWTLRNGPFRERDFARLPKRNWTLLVQDVDKWDADVAALLEAFAFLPAWRIDDIMVSYATDGGGVGPHVDQYDVFLVQGRGRRRWRISTDPDAPTAFRDDAELKLLRQFAPTHDWTLDPGDALYLPPGIPHEGTAVGDCLTFSVGMRAPSIAELVLDYAEHVAEPLGEERRYADADLAVARDAHEIDAAALRRAADALAVLRRSGDADLGSWFGRFITRYRSAQVAAAPARPVTATSIAARLDRSLVVRNPWTRMAWARDARKARLFAGGDEHGCTRAFATLLSSRREIDGSELRRVASRADLNVLAELVNSGHCALGRRR